jgi:hypothetical protein
VNTRYAHYRPVEIVTEVLVSVLVLYLLTSFLSWDFSDLKGKFVRGFFRFARNIPQVQQKIKKERESVKSMIIKKLHLDAPTTYTIPEKGLSKEQILSTMAKFQAEEEKHYQEGKVSGALYTRDKSHMDLINKAYSLYSYSNSLHPEMYPSVRKYEIEVIRMTAYDER